MHDKTILSVKFVRIEKLTPRIQPIFLALPRVALENMT